MKKTRQIKIVFDASALGLDGKIPGTAYRAWQSRIYLSKKHREAQKILRAQLMMQLPDDFKIFEGNVKINMCQYRQPLKKHWNKVKIGDNCGDKPDFSNQFKFVEDILSTVVFIDDKHVVGTFGEQDKKYDHENPRVEVIVREAK